MAQAPLLKPIFRWALVLAGMAVLCLGCKVVDVHNTALEPPLPDVMRAPAELKKISLPEYRIEPPDVLQIEMLKLVPLPPYRAESFDVLQIHVLGALPDQPIDNYYIVEAEGTINLGPAYGTVRVAGMTLDEIKHAVEKKLQEVLKAPEVSVQLARVAGPNPSPANTWWGPMARSTCGNTAW